MVFIDRLDAGRRLASQLGHLRGRGDVVVVGLPRGGVPVAAVIADELDAPLDVIVVRKLGVPYQPELGMGAIGEDGIRVINDEVVRIARATPADIERVAAKERAELERRAQAFRADHPRIPLAGRTVVVVDDGVATGSTARAACQVAHVEGAERVILAVPVAPDDWTARLSDVADELVAVETPRDFHAVGQFYADFGQTSDREVVELLGAASARRTRPSSAPTEERPPADVELVLGAATLGGHLTVPPATVGLVLFAHGSGSSRHSPRNRLVADVLHGAGLATLLFDLLTPDEAGDRRNVFDIELLAGRLSGAAEWARTEFPDVPIGYFGASTGAAAALRAAAEPESDVAAVVSRGGRPDLARPRLGLVRAPTLLIVGGLDHAVLELNREARRELRCESELQVVDGATHLFEEPGTLRTAAELARDWLVRHLSVTAAR